jgi:hypothetical protein
MPRGGARIGAGAKSTKVLPMRLATSTEPVAVPEPPETLTSDETAVWRELAPAAAQNGMLTPATLLGFRHLCEITVLCRALRAVIDVEGWQMVSVRVDSSGQEHVDRKSHPLWTRLEAATLRAEQAWRAYGLFANGKPQPAAAAAAEADPWADRAKKA